MSNTEAVDFRQVREFSAVLNDTFSFYRTHFKPLTKTLFATLGPLILIAVIVGAWQQLQSPALTGKRDTFGFLFSGTYWLSAGISYILNLFIVSLYAAMVYEYIQSYVEGQGSEAIVASLRGKAMKHLVKILFASIIVGILVMLGFMFCIVPGIYLAVIFSLTLPVLVHEKTSIFDAIGRSRELVSGYGWFTFGLLVVFFLLMVVVGFIVVMPSILATMLVTMHSTDQATSMSNIKWVLVGLTLASTVISYLCYAIPMIGISVHYHSLVERKESKGLSQEIDQIGGSGVE